MADRDRPTPARLRHGSRARLRFAADWSRIQGQFVDDPTGAVIAANDVIKPSVRRKPVIPLGVSLGFLDRTFCQRLLQSLLTRKCAPGPKCLP